VDHEVGTGSGEGIDHLGERRPGIVPAARVQPGRAPLAYGEAALAVELALVDPALGPEPLMAERGERRLPDGAHAPLLVDDGGPPGRRAVPGALARVGRSCEHASPGPAAQLGRSDSGRLARALLRDVCPGPPPDASRGRWVSMTVLEWLAQVFGAA